MGFQSGLTSGDRIENARHTVGYIILDVAERLQKDIDNLGALLAQKEGELDEQGTLIDRLRIENGFLKERCGELRAENERLEVRLDALIAQKQK